MNTENLNQETLNNVNDEIQDMISSDYQSELAEEQAAFEEGIVDDEPIIDMEESDINEQTMMFLKLRGKK